MDIGSVDGDAQDDGNDDYGDSNDGNAYTLFAVLAGGDVVDVDSDAITHTPPVGIARALHATTASAASLFVLGGVNTTGMLSSCEEFNTQTMRLAHRSQLFN